MMNFSRVDSLVTVLLITHNRPNYLRRTLDYYSRVGFGLPILIADSSGKECGGENERICSEVSGSLNISYENFGSHLGLIEKFISATSKIETPFIAFSGDDDFLIESSVENCAGFLFENDDYAVVDGREIRVLVDAGGDPHKTNSYVLPQVDIESDSPVERLEHHLTQYWPTFYGVHRKDNFEYIARKATGFTLQGKMASSIYIFHELYMSALTLIKGKYKCLPCLHIVRQNEHKSSSPFDSWEKLITDSSFLEPSKFMRDDLSDEACLVSPDVSQDEAMRAFNRGFDSFLSGFVSLAELDDIYTTIPTRSELVDRVGEPIPRAFNVLADPAGEIQVNITSRYFTIEELVDVNAPYCEPLVPILESCIEYPEGIPESI